MRASGSMSNIYVLEFLIILGLFLGSLFINIYYSKNIGIQKVFDYDFIEKMQRMNIDGKELFNYIFIQRLKIWVILLILSISFAGHMIPYLYSIAAGFMAGLTCSCIVMSHGLKGILIFAVVCMLPHIMVFFGNIIMIYTVINSQKRTISLVKMLPILMFSQFFILVSAFLESSFNLVFIANFY
jgi:hypothetical protein